MAGRGARSLKATASEAEVEPLLRETGKRGLIYFDDGSSARSVAGQIAGATNVPFAKADVVLDALSGLVDMSLIARAAPGAG